jgi:fructose-specific phosphotransferase system component IIB
MKLVVITNYAAGVAHTYKVAETLEQNTHSPGYSIKVET